MSGHIADGSDDPSDPNRHADSADPAESISPEDLESLVERAQSGDDAARSRLYEILTADMRNYASSLMRRERNDHTLQVTALIHEAFIRLANSDVIGKVESVDAMRAAGTQLMRQILIDHARKRKTTKRGGDRTRQEMDVVIDGYQAQIGYDFLEVAEALEQLSTDEQAVIGYRFEHRMTYGEIADVMNISEAEVKKLWALAKTRLVMLLSDKAT